MRRVITAVVVAGLLAGCGGSDPVNLSDPKSIANRLGCEHFEDRPADNGYPDLIDRYTRCDYLGHRIFILTFKHPGAAQELQKQLGDLPGAVDRWVAGDTWEIDDPQGTIAELEKIRDRLGQPDAQIHG